MSTERRIFYSAVLQVPTSRRIPSNTGKIPVIVRLYKETRFWFDGPQDYEVVVPRTLVAALGDLFCRERVSHMVAEQLLRLPIPRENVPPIMDKLVQKLALVSNVPSHLPITVLILDIAVSLMGTADYDHVIDWVANQTFSFMRHLIRGGEVIGESSKRAPAATSFIHGLEKIRFDSLEESVIRGTPTCAVCLQDFADSVEELITCLPCKHHYHNKCIVLCLEINHICPMCRYPMPTAEACKPLTNATAN